ncbi:hypothetical protein EBZ80_01175 [bacterium]|nr:hypothetical protein [bacterium]
MNPRVFFLCLLVLFIVGFRHARVYNTLLEAYTIVITDSREGIQIARLEAELRSCSRRGQDWVRCARIGERLWQARTDRNDLHAMIRVTVLLLSLFLPVDVDQGVRYAYLALVLVVLHTCFTLLTTGRRQEKQQQKTTRRGSRIQPAETSPIPALLERLEAMDPQWEENAGDFLRSLLNEVRGPLTYRILQYPVVSPQGHLYQRDDPVGIQWLRNRQIDPITNRSIDREAIVRHVPRVVSLIELILRQALREAEARREADVQQIVFQEERVPARDHPAFGRFVRGHDREGLLRALHRSRLTDSQKEQMIAGLDEPQKRVRVRRKQKKE